MFKLPTSERLNRWKLFRMELNSMPLDLALQESQRFWKSCPFTPFYLDSTTCSSWPDPWQLIEENYYCDLAKCLGIVYTLYLTSHKNNLEPEIRIYRNEQTLHYYHIAYFHQGKYVLNLIEDEVVNKEHINQRFKLKHCYTAADLKLEQY